MKNFIANIIIRIATFFLRRSLKEVVMPEYMKSGYLRNKQVIFLLNVAKLIQYSKALDGYELTAGEMWRTQEQQAIYLAKKLTRRKYSQHQKRLAIDLNVFINGNYRTDKEAFKPIAAYWKELNKNNQSGYDWDWDYNHFEMK